MQKNKLSYSETARYFEVNDHHRIPALERIYLEEGAEGFYQERRGRASKGRPMKLPKKWVTDVTEFSLFGQRLYLSPILNLCSRDIVSYSISEKPVLSLVTSMLDKAFSTIPSGTNLIIHSDQGWQYQHKTRQRMLKAKGIRQSMSRKVIVWTTL